MKKIGVAIIAIFTIIAISATPIFAVTYGSIYSYSNNTTLFTDSSGSLTINIIADSKPVVICSSSINTYGTSYRVTSTAETVTTSLTENNTVYSQDFVIQFRMVNSTNKDIYISAAYANLRPDFTIGSSVPTYQSYNITNFEGSLFGGYSLNTNGYITFRWSTEYSYNGRIVVPAGAILSQNITCTMYYFDYESYNAGNIVDPSNYAMQLNSTSILAPVSSNCSVITNFSLYNDDYNSPYIRSALESINNNVQEIHDTYISNSQNISDTQSNITDVGNEESQLHQAELNYYLQNQQALQNVGISNFSFSSDQSSGLGAVVSDFSELWNNIGPLQIIFTFTLSMSLATYLLRHRPITGAIKQNERKK